MAKFNPIEFGYELVSKDEDAGTFHYQKIRLTKVSVMTDILELVYWSKQNTWILFVEMLNLKSFLPNTDISDEHHIISLFIGRIKNDMNFRFIMNNITKDPKVLVQLGC